MLLVILSLAVIVTFADILCLEEVRFNGSSVVALNLIFITQSAKLLSIIDIELFLCFVDFNAAHNIQDTYVFIYFLNITITAATIEDIPYAGIELLTEVDDIAYYRMYIFIEGARTYNVVEKPEHFYNAAKAFGRFQKLLADFPACKLYETIKDFHNTPKRFADFEEAITNNISGRADNVKKEIEFALERKNIASAITDAIKDGSIPLRVTHNDTKYNNIMIDEITGKAVAVIDLDTVMPGSLLYDYGDSLRFGTNPVSEDEKNLDLVYCDLNLFECFTRGFIEEMADTLTPDEIRLMPLSARLMTLECGIRFLGDYINGDVYFKTAYSEHNLDRARTQFKLVYDMEQKQSEMDKIVSDIIGKLSEK